MTFAAFRELAHRATARGERALVPVWRDYLLDTETPVAVFAKLRESPFAFLLESAPAGGETWARYTFLGTAPRTAWRLRDGAVEDWTPDRGWHGARRPADPLADLDTLLRRYTPVDVPELGAFWSGAVGFFGYDVVRYIERLPKPPAGAADRRASRFLVRVTVSCAARAQPVAVHVPPRARRVGDRRQLARAARPRRATKGYRASDRGHATAWEDERGR